MSSLATSRHDEPDEPAVLTSLDGPRPEAVLVKAGLHVVDEVATRRVKLLRYRTGKWLVSRLVYLLAAVFGPNAVVVDLGCGTETAALRFWIAFPERR